MPVRHALASSLPAAAPQALARTRFMVQAGRGQHELLSVRERHNGDLSILIPAHGPAIGPKGILEYRISVLASRDPDGAFILYDNSMRDGHREKSVVFLQPRRRSLLLPLYTVRCRDMSARVPFRPPAVDRLVPIATYDPALSVLVYHVALSGREQSIEGLSDFNSLALDFERFRITLLWGFMRAPSLGDGGVRGLALAPCHGSDIPHGRRRIAARKSLSVAEAGIELRHARSIISQDHVAALKRLFANEAVAPDPRFERVAYHYSLQPLR